MKNKTKLIVIITLLAIIILLLSGCGERVATLRIVNQSGKTINAVYLGFRNTSFTDLDIPDGSSRNLVFQLCGESDLWVYASFEDGTQTAQRYFTFTPAKTTRVFVNDNHLTSRNE